MHLTILEEIILKTMDYIVVCHFSHGKVNKL